MAQTQIPWHWHEEVEFGYLEQGNLEVRTVNQTYHFHSGEGFFINPNVLASMQSDSKNPNSIYCAHLFHPIFLSGHFKSIFETKYVAPVIQDKRFDLVELHGTTALQKTILSLQKASALQEQPDQEFQIRNLFSEIWLLLISEIELLKTKTLPIKPMEQERIQTMLSYIQQNYMHPISLEEIALSCGFSNSAYFRKIFRERKGMTPGTYRKSL